MARVASRTVKWGVRVRSPSGIALVLSAIEPPQEEECRPTKVKSSKKPGTPLANTPPVILALLLWEPVSLAASHRCPPFLSLGPDPNLQVPCTSVTLAVVPQFGRIRNGLRLLGRDLRPHLVRPDQGKFQRARSFAGSKAGFCKRTRTCFPPPLGRTNHRL